MKSFIYFFVLFFVCDVAAQTTKAQWIDYVSSDKTIQFSYPKDWKLQENEQGYTVYLTINTDEKSIRPDAVIGLSTIPIPNNSTATIESIKQQNINSVAGNKDGKMLDVNYKNLKEYPGLYMDFIFSDTTTIGLKHHISWLIEKDRTWYLFRYMSNTKMDEAYLETAKNIITSLELSTNSSTPSNTNALNENKTQKLNTKSAQMNSAGSIAANAKVLDVDELFPFSDGVARVRKGESYALIDPSGNFVVPFNKWQILRESESELLVVTTAGSGYDTKYGMINTKGKVILPCVYKADLFPIDHDGYVHMKGDPSFFINTKGNKVIFSLQANLYYHSEDFSENLGSIKDYKTDKQGYANRKGEVVIPLQFDAALPFSEGLAVVGKKNEFGEMKYGFIDKTGKVIIPFQFTNAPRSFSEGRAMVEPVKKDEFTYAYIDKQGKIVLTIKNAPDGKALYPLHHTQLDFVNGYTEWKSNGLNPPSNTYLLDTLGRFTTLENYLKPTGLDINSMGGWVGIQYAKKGVLVLPGKGLGMGLLDVKSKKALPFLYWIESQFLNYDPIAKLVKVQLYDHKKDSKDWLEGYINSEGVFVIIKGKGSKW